MEKLQEERTAEPGDALHLIINSARELGREPSVQELKVGDGRPLLPPPRPPAPLNSPSSETTCAVHSQSYPASHSFEAQTWLRMKKKGSGHDSTTPGSSCEALALLPSLALQALDLYSSPLGSSYIPSLKACFCHPPTCAAVLSPPLNSQGPDQTPRPQSYIFSLPNQHSFFYKPP